MCWLCEDHPPKVKDYSVYLNLDKDRAKIEAVLACDRQPSGNIGVAYSVLNHKDEDFPKATFACFNVERWRLPDASDDMADSEMQADMRECVQRWWKRSMERVNAA